MSGFYSPTLATLSLAIIIGVLGAFYGDFCSKLIYRLENNRFDRFAVFRPSICPSCGTKLKLKDKIPFYSYVNLKGECRRCHEPIAKRYLVLEIIGLVLPFFLLWFDNFSVKSVFDYFLLMSIITQAYIYYDTQDFSNQLSLFILLISLISTIVNGEKLLSFLISFVVSFILIYLISLILKEKNSSSYIVFFTCYSSYFTWQNSILILLIFMIYYILYRIYLLIKLKRLNCLGLLLVLSMATEFLFQNYLVQKLTLILRFLIN